MERIKIKRKPATTTTTTSAPTPEPAPTPDTRIVRALAEATGALHEALAEADGFLAQSDRYEDRNAAVQLVRMAVSALDEAASDAAFFAGLGRPEGDDVHDAYVKRVVGHVGAVRRCLAALQALHEFPSP